MQEDKKQEHEKRLEALSKPKKITEKWIKSSYKDGRYITSLILDSRLIIMMNSYTKDHSVPLLKHYHGIFFEYLAFTPIQVQVLATNFLIKLLF